MGGVVKPIRPGSAASEGFTLRTALDRDVRRCSWKGLESPPAVRRSQLQMNPLPLG